MLSAFGARRPERLFRGCAGTSGGSACPCPSPVRGTEGDLGSDPASEDCLQPDLGTSVSQTISG